MNEAALLHSLTDLCYNATCMIEQRATSQQTITGAFQDTLTAPLLFLSSEDTGWEDLLVRAYHEPARLEGWISPAVPEIGLILLTSGKMLMEHPGANGSWRGWPMHQGDLMLKPAGGTNSEVRWRSLSTEPMQTVHIHLNSDLFSRTAEEVADLDPARLTLYGRPAFQDPLLTQIGLALRRELEYPMPTGKIYAQTAAQMLAVHLLRYYTTPNHQIKETHTRSDTSSGWPGNGFCAGSSEPGSLAVRASSADRL